jgi:Domain of unknown function (DUF2017)
MARAFRRGRRGLAAELDAVEREVVARLAEDVAAMLDPGEAPGPADPLARLVGIAEATPERPRDPAVARLLPDASGDDADAAAEFRRLTERGLRERKRAGLATVADTLRRADGDRVVLDEAQARAWVVALTDVRLVLAERLGLRDDDDAALLHLAVDGAAEDDPRAWLAAVYDLLSWLQETLVEALAPR